MYSRLGASSRKEDVHEAIKDVDKGLFPGAFCKIVLDVAGREEYCSVFHSDGAGTKSSLAYMYYKETGDISVFQGVVRDAIVMNTDDVLCIGATGDFFLSNNIGRNSKFISGKIISTVIKEYHEYARKLKTLGLNLIISGGETADVGDLVRTIILDASLFTSVKREHVIDASNIEKGDVIVGLASFGKASYEDDYNSGIGSNGLTLARHGTLSPIYRDKYPEAYDNNLNKSLAFFGKHVLTENLGEGKLTLGKALLSPTKTYAPVIIEVLKQFRAEIHGIIHNTGGGQTKSLGFGEGLHYVKNDLFKLPKIFEIIQDSSNTQWKEMYQVFNMGHRLEIYCKEEIANKIIQIAKKYQIQAKIIGRCESSPKGKKNVLEIDSPHGKFTYE